MITTCWSVKGGSGTTVIAATLGLLTTRSLVVDLDGDITDVLGLPRPEGPGAPDWVASEAPAEHLADLVVEVDADTMLIPHRPTADTAVSARDTDRWHVLGRWLRDWARTHDGDVVVDAGTGPPPDAILEVSDRSLLVTRACYLALRAATRCLVRPSGIILIEEPGRSLRSRDVEHSVGAPVVATIPFDVAVARAADSGLLTRNLPYVLRRSTRSVTS